MEEFIKYLKKLGFSEREIEVYLKLYTLGPSTILELSKNLASPRTTIHQIIARLQSQGVVSTLIVGVKKKFVAESPQYFERIHKSKKIELETKLKDLNSFELDFNKFLKFFDNVKKDDNSSKTQIKIYEGKKAVSKIYDRILESKTLKTYANAEEIMKYLPENHFKFQNAVQKGLELWDLFVPNEVSKHNASDYIGSKNYHVKFFPENIKINSMDYLIYEDNIAIIQADKKNITAIVIENELLAENARNIYDLLWKLLP